MKHIRLMPVPFLSLLAFVSFLFIISFSCRKENSMNPDIPDGRQRVSIRLSDGPVDFDAVYVDIQQVEVLVIPDSCQGGTNQGEGPRGCYYDHHRDHYPLNYRCAVWDTLSIRPGVYNLLDLSNGADTLLASGITVQGKIKMIRLTLGDNNHVVADSVSYPLGLWNTYNRVTISLRGEDVEEISPGNLQLWLDFDAGRSIVRVSNNHFILKPWLRIWLPAQTGTIKGRVLPHEAHAVVSAISGGDTLVAIPDRFTGWFKIRGISGSSADLLINATANNYSDTTITGLPVNAGDITDTGTIHLHQ